MKLVPYFMVQISHSRIDAVLPWQPVSLDQLYDIRIILCPVDSTTHIGGQLGRDKTL